MSTITVIHESDGCEIARVEIEQPEIENRDDLLTSDAIFAAIENDDWILAPGDTILIVEGRVTE